MVICIYCSFAVDLLILSLVMLYFVNIVIVCHIATIDYPHNHKHCVLKRPLHLFQSTLIFVKRCFFFISYKTCIPILRLGKAKTIWFIVLVSCCVNNIVGRECQGCIFLMTELLKYEKRYIDLQSIFLPPNNTIFANVFNALFLLWGKKIT